MSEIRFDNFFAPRSVAIVGASPKRGSARNTLVRVLLKHGFAGNVYPVSQSSDEIEGLKAYPTLVSLPEVPDVALIITPAATIADIIAECGAKGISHAIVYSSGFEETKGGKVHAERLAAAAREHGVTVIGANCNGIWSVREKTMLTFGPAALNLDTLQHAPIAIISQSGALAGAIANSLQQNAIGCSYIVAVGNETCVDAVDILGAVIERDDVRVVSLYIEGLNDAARILKVAERARERDIQIVVLKAGRSAIGQQATASHTGKIASSHSVYTDVLKQAGVIAVDSLAEMLAAVEALAFMVDPRIADDRKAGVSVLSSSGGAGALLADHSSEFGISMAEFGEATARTLDDLLPDFARKANPVDLTGQINAVPTLFRDTFLAVAADQRTEALVVQFASSGRRYLNENADTFKSVAKVLPVVVSFSGEIMEKEVRQDFRQAGVLLSSDPAATMRALSWLYDRERARSLPPVPHGADLPQRDVPHDWASLMALCDDSGVTPAKWLVLGPDDRASVACATLRYPLVVKVLPSESEHKTELGLVKLRVASAEDVDGHAAAFRKQLGKPDMGVLVQEMVGDGVEVVLSCLRQSDFGPTLSIGSGGVAIELYRDITHLALPVTEAQVITALQRLKLWTLLQGFRGKPACEIDALAKAAVRLGDQFLATPDMAEFEINPVIVKPVGEGLCAVDALAVATAKA
jgi:acyl-CoA synthetase (NDP forming)